jgi:hypothetical protein
MYIPEFWAGLIVGVLATIGAIVVWGLWLGKKGKNS